MADGSAFDYSDVDPGADMQKLMDAIQAVDSGDPPLCGVEADLPHIHAVRLVQQNPITPVRAELVRHRDILGDRLEFYLLLNKMRWYLVYLRKSHNPWAGGTEFARGINAEAGRYRAELGGFFSRCDRLLLRMDRRRWMRPGVLAVSTLMRWGKSLKRRLAH